ncbi:AAA family ATPase, CDC48 subfamily [Staphylothermus marinus F1]|uniref:AAA family ATPase, CDC48 subfamily n=1 Tax=Staphylothermus marinus (strain ATCC 43588 / DSM 3639 / JCM 9404 / F1) TaxID=399550 RepID=A3DNK9_STAMF|nr:CDC48 family AAA ATPase [Staphylothermus marinus]ABN70219.1 AAA family ATPase, CDC48 subfamily [Staphylothermus marinus F1]
MPRNNNREIRLRVAEARQRDVGRKIVRISRTDMARIGVVTGDFVEIIGPRGSIIAQVWPAYPEDEGKDIIRMDGYLRRAIGASVGDIVSVKKTSVEPATKVVLAPTEPIRFGPDFVEYVRQFLIRKPLSRGEEIEIPIFGMSLKFVVIATQPGYRVYVTDETEIQIRSEPVKEEVIERARMIPKVTWEDIGDLEEAKQKIREIVELPLKHPELFKHLGIEPPKGILLYGPPGTGKTLLAKALANEIGAYFTAINGPEIMSKFYGESEQRLREIFEEAERNAPAIIFIDEIDSIAPKREEVTGEVEKRVVAQLLALMDGLKERGKVIVIGATNRPDALDPALRRPGRFDREIEIPPPDKRARREILAVHTRNMPLEEDVDLDKIAEMTHGYTGADLAALVKEAAMAALRRFIKEGKIDLTQPIPAEKLRDLKVKMSDFLEAMKYVQPTLIREIYVEVPEVRWSDIGGLEDVKQQLREAVEWPMKHPEVFEQMGIEPPKGILLFGPPGTGKTLLAKAVATESGANFIAVRGPEILSKWVGESEKAIRQIFRRARQVAPAVVFFDEIDSIAPARGYRHDTSGVTDRIVNQLLTELDGIEPLRKVVVIAATNRPDILDPALLRPGRFDRLIYVPPPDFKARIEIFKVHTKKMPLAPDVDLEELARRTEGYTGADIAAVCREAAILALREEFKVRPVEMKHFLEALKHVPPSLTRTDMERYERMAKELKRMGGLPYRV